MIRVERAGLLSTIQDRGRRGVQRHGIVTAGPMDATAHRVANLLVGNDIDAATIECTMIGPALAFNVDATVAITGGDFVATLEAAATRGGVAVPRWCPFPVRAGDVLVLGAARSGCRGYIAIGGGIDVPPVLGSRSTDLIAGIGGLDGRALRTGDTLPVGSPGGVARCIHDRIHAVPREARAAGRSVMPAYAAEPVVGVIRGPEHDAFTAASRSRLVSAEFEVTPQSNRMGLRLRGPVLALEGVYDMVSSPVAEGMVQVPPSGEPIVLMADHQTIGGYPRIGAVISVDLPLLAQAPPGARVRFREVELAEAQSRFMSRERDLRMLATSIRLHYV